MNRFFSRFSEIVDVVAGVLLAAIGILIFAATIGRYFFSHSVPDAVDISRLLLGALIMWGFAAVGYRGGHITADVVYELFSARIRRYIDIFAWIVLLIATVFVSWKMYTSMGFIKDSGRTTVELRITEWPFHLAIWLGSVASIVTITARILSLALSRDWNEETTKKSADPADKGGVIL